MRFHLVGLPHAQLPPLDGADRLYTWNQGIFGIIDQFLGD